MDILLNWLWQGVIVALAAAALLWAIGPARPEARYRVAGVALLLVTLLPAVPFIFIFIQAAAAPLPPLQHLPDPPGPMVSVPPDWWLLTVAVEAAWLLWLVVQGGRLASGWLALRRARASATALGPEWTARLATWSRLGTMGRRATLVCSPRVRTAAVLGGVRPAIAVSPAVLDRLSDEEIDRIVVHEWAHVRRYDDITHVVQQIVHTIAGWHPAASWLDRQVHFEREAACDALAVAATGSAKRYASCLAKLAALPAPERPLPAPSALPASGLRRRIMRILALRDGQPAARSRAAALAAGAGVGLLAFAVGTMPVVALGRASEPLVDSARAALRQALVADRVRAPQPFTPPPIPPIEERDARAQEPDAPVVMGPSRVDAAAPVDREQPAPPDADPTPSVDPPPLPLTGSTPRTDLSSLGSPSVHLAQPPEPAPGPVAEPAGPWATAVGAATGAGQAIARSSQKAARSTAGFFTRFARKVAGSF